MPSSQFHRLAAAFNAGQVTLGDPSDQTMETEQAYREADANEVSIYVEAILPDGNIYPQRGKIIFFDSTENAQTSSLEIKAEFANPEHSRVLMPGQFIRVRIVGAVFKDAILIPTSAVLNTAQGLISYVIKDDNTVEARPIEAQLENDMYLVTKGLNAGDKVVSGGLVKVRAGEKVTPQMQEFKVSIPAEKKEVQTANGDTVGKLEDEIAAAEAPDTESIQAQALSSAPAASTNSPAAN